MRGWHPSIAMTSVVPERSAPIMMTGRSLRLSGILRSLEIADPCEEVQERPRRCRLEPGADADLLEDHFAVVAVVERYDHGAQLDDLIVRDLRRRDEGHVRQLAALRDDPPAVFLPRAPDARDGV